MSGFDVPGHLTMKALHARTAVGMSHLIGSSFARIRACAAAIHGHDEWSEEAIDQASLWEAAMEWVAAGRQRFRISDSLAALFRLTTAPDIDTDTLPFSSFLVEVPAEYLPLKRDDGSLSLASWILFSSSIPPGETERVVFYGAIADDASGVIRRGECNRLVVSEADVALNEAPPEAKLAARFVGNLVAFLLEFPASATTEKHGRVARDGSAPPPPVMIRPPPDVTVTREMRDAARGAASSVSIGGIRRAMAHFVRGHWRNQPVGEGRKDIRRTWVKPHKRGDEAFGRVVERITKVTGGEN